MPSGSHRAILRCPAVLPLHALDRRTRVSGTPWASRALEAARQEPLTLFNTISLINPPAVMPCHQISSKALTPCTLLSCAYPTCPLRLPTATAAYGTAIQATYGTFSSNGGYNSFFYNSYGTCDVEVSYDCLARREPDLCLAALLLTLGETTQGQQGGGGDGSGAKVGLAVGMGVGLGGELCVRMQLRVHSSTWRCKLLVTGSKQDACLGELCAAGSCRVAGMPGRPPSELHAVRPVRYAVPSSCRQVHVCACDPGMLRCVLQQGPSPTMLWAPAPACCLSCLQTVPSH